MPKPPAPPDPSATITDDGEGLGEEQEVPTSEMPQFRSGPIPTGTEPGVDSGATSALLPWIDDSGTTPGETGPHADTGPQPAVLPSQAETGPAPAVIPSHEDTGPTPALIPSHDDTGPTPALIPSHEDTGPTPALIRSHDDTGPSPVPGPFAEDGGPTQSLELKTAETVIRSAPAPVRRSKVDHAAIAARRPTKAPSPGEALPELSLLDVSELSTNPVRRQLQAAELAARATVTPEEPDPKRAWLAWLASPASRGWRLWGALTLGIFATVLLAFLFTPASAPVRPPPARRILRPDAPERPGVAQPVDLTPGRKPIAQAPIYLDVEVDAGEGAVRIEKVEAGVMKLGSSPPTEVTVAGRRLGVTPVYLTAPVGRVEVLLESRELGIYKPVYVTVYAGRNPAQSWDLGLGWLEVAAPAGSQVWVDGRAVGKAPVAQLSLYEGFHRVEVMRPNKTRVTSRVEVVARFTSTHDVPPE